MNCIPAAAAAAEEETVEEETAEEETAEEENAAHNPSGTFYPIIKTVALHRVDAEQLFHGIQFYLTTYYLPETLFLPPKEQLFADTAI